MSDLQDAADRLANRIPLEPGDREVLVEAARKWANPDIDAAEAITYKLRYIKDGDEWDDKIYGITKEAVAAALGVTEDV